MEATVCNQVKHLYEVEKLSIRQIAQKLRMASKTVARVIRNERLMRSYPDSMLRPYERLIDQWYQEYPFLKASQVYERLKSYGFRGSYGTVSVWTQRYRQKRRQAYHELTFLPGEEAQIDWIEERLPWGVAYGFAMILAYSRYLFVRFYPRQSLEFFLEAPIEALKEEQLKALPAIAYHPYRVVLASVSKTGFVEFETNRYSVASSYAESSCEILVYPDHLEVMVKGNRIAFHRRSFNRKEKIEDPTHRERLLRMTPQFKSQRIYQLMNQMDPALHHFLQEAQQEGHNPLEIAYEFFKLLKHVSKAMLLSAVRQATRIGTFKIRYVQSLLQVPQPQPPNPVYPQESKLLDIDYERRNLKDYDELL